MPPLPRQLQTIDEIFRQIDREVWIVTAAVGQRRGGLLATWISQISLDPAHPAVLAGIAPNHFTAELIDGSARFALHLLRQDQSELGLHFALGSGRDRDKLGECGAAWRLSEAGVPLLEDCLARLECQVYSRYDTNDRNFYWAHVLAGTKRAAGPPLREHQLVAEASEQQRQLLKEDRQRDAQRSSPQ